MVLLFSKWCHFCIIVLILSYLSGHEVGLDDISRELQKSAIDPLINWSITNAHVLLSQKDLPKSTIIRPISANFIENRLKYDLVIN